ncbi:MAG TPA: nickel-binding protein [Roseiflexaceae bacterium]|nr:nickel-binding protein [Roseiflexaceae bacterium]
MGIYLVDRDLPGLTAEGLALLVRAELSASQQLTAAGQAVRELRSLFIVGEARCMCLFEAEDEAAVAVLNEAARLPFTRIVAALDLSP